MRESCFRGKKLDNGEWVEGAYFKHDTVKTCLSSDDPKPKHLILQDGFCDWGLEPPIHGVAVDPATVGQYTGLTANGKKIFEGDVLRYGLLAVPAVAVVKFGEYSFGSQFDMNCVGFYLEWTPRAMYYRTDLGFWVKQREIEIIGNIYDNPELLEVEE